MELQLVEEAISRGDVELLANLYSSSKEIRDVIKENLDSLRLNAGVQGESFKEIVEDYDRRFLLEFYLGNLYGFVRFLKNTEKP